MSGGGTCVPMLDWSTSYQAGSSSILTVARKERKKGCVGESLTYFYWETRFQALLRHATARRNESESPACSQSCAVHPQLRQPEGQQRSYRNAQPTHLHAVAFSSTAASASLRIYGTMPHPPLPSPTAFLHLRIAGPAIFVLPGMLSSGALLPSDDGLPIELYAIIFACITWFGIILPARRVRLSRQ
ncbi:hypothetical protein BJV77DRAFT_1028998 [Russula vinacea]|nr:hypothetical protein BJV77DRAFT_1028998 [Russula vinacea]